MDKTNEAAVDSSVGGDTNTGVDSSSSVGGEQDNTDWKALAEKEHARAENYKTAFTQKREFVKAGVTEEVQEEDDGKPLTRADIRKVVSDTVVPLVAQNKVDVELEKQIKDPEKRKFVKILYETRVRQMGTSDDAIHQDISAALAIADAQKLKQASAEVIRKQNMQTSPNLSGSSSDSAPVSKNHKFSDQQVVALTARAKSLGMEPTKFIEQTWKNQNRG